MGGTNPMVELVEIEPTTSSLRILKPVRDGTTLRHGQIQLGMAGLDTNHDTNRMSAPPSTSAVANPCLR
jgi:hypothetical protein